MKPWLVVSTVGTSVLTNFERSLRGGGVERCSLTKWANLSEDDLTPDQRALVERVADGVRRKLAQTPPAAVKPASAELNALVSYYGDAMGDPARLSADHHVLVTTDTYQGQISARLLHEWLAAQGFGSCQELVVPRLSTRDEYSFRAGIDWLIGWTATNLPSYRNSGHKVVFNLVGSFKSLHGYMVTLGMLYADELIYIFEGDGSQLIRIPRLPVTLRDFQCLSEHAANMLLLEERDVVRKEDLSGLPEALLECDQQGYCTLSAWGYGVWAANRTEILGSVSLLRFPKIEYSERFRRDFLAVRDKELRAKVLRVLAQVSVLLRAGGRERLREHGGLQYESLEAHKNIDHFRIDDGVRVTCEPVRGGLLLRRLGEHDAVLTNP